MEARDVFLLLLATGFLSFFVGRSTSRDYKQFLLRRLEEQERELQAIREEVAEDDEADWWKEN